MAIVLTNKCSNKPNIVNTSSKKLVLVWGVGKPFLDRLTVTLKISDPDEAHAMYCAHQTLQKSESVTGSQRRTGGYNRAVRIKLESTVVHDAWPHYSWRQQDKQISNCRIDFNPAHLGHDGIFEMHSVLGTVMDFGWRSFAERGRVTRADIAVDMPHLHFCDLQVYANRSLLMQSWKNKSELETLCLGAPGANQMKIYDRSKKHAKFGTQGLGKTGLRFECVCRQTGIPPMLLAALPNPFKRYSVVSGLNSSTPDGWTDWNWKLFLKAAQLDGVGVAIDMLPKSEKKNIRKHLAELKLGLWDPDKFWTRWPDSLANLKLADPACWF